MKKMSTIIIGIILTISIFAQEEIKRENFDFKINESLPKNLKRNEIKGTLYIVGGAQDDNTSYTKFFELAGGSKKAKIGIIGAASDSPASMSVKNIMVENFGADPDNIILLPLAVKDDKRTKDVDESQWIKNGNNLEIVKMVEELDGIWFRGGDQARITKVLLNEDNSPTAVLEAIWKIYKKGGIIGGTSAGAAIMSDVMIANGSSRGALLEGLTEENSDNEQEGLCILTGLNFFQYGILDQHFDKKARLGRLLFLNAAFKNTYPIGFGIDENTILIYNAKTDTIEVEGSGTITIVDARKTKIENDTYTNFLVSYIQKGDIINMKNMVYTIDKTRKIFKEKNSNNEKYSQALDNPLGTGVMSNYGTNLKDFMAYLVADNSVNIPAKSYIFDKNGSGYEILFSKTKETEGYAGYNFPEGLWKYSILNVNLNLIPVTIKIEKRK